MEHNTLEVFSGLEYREKIAFHRPFFPEASSIFILKSGKIVFEKGLQLVEISTPVISFFDASMVYEFSHISDDLDAYVISFSPEYYNSLSERLKTLKAYHYFKSNIGKAFPVNDVQLAEIFPLVNALQQIIRNRELHKESKELTDNLFYAVTQVISDYLEVKDTAKPSVSRAESITLTFLQNVEANFRQHKKVEFYAEKQFVTVRHLSVILKTTVGKTALQIINEIVQKEAMALLAGTDKNITEIADHLGFADSQSFHHFFKRLTGITPVQYRKHFSGN